MKYTDIIVELISDDSKGVHIFLPNNYDFMLDGKILSAKEKNIKIIGFYTFDYKRYEEINEDNYSRFIYEINGPSENYKYQKENIFNHEFKTYYMKFNDSNIHKVYMYKITDEIIGRVELRYLESNSNNEFSSLEVKPYLLMLIKSKVEQKNVKNMPKYFDLNRFARGTLNNPDYVIKDLKEKSSMMNMMLFLALIAIIVGIGFDIYIKHLLMTYIGLFWGLFLMAIYVEKYYLGKKHLKNVDIDDIKKELANECISFNYIKTYFTSNYVISCYYHSFAIKYSDIIWMYQVKNHSETNLVMYTKNKQRLVILFSKEFVNIISSHNSEVLYGNTPEFKKKYKELIKIN